MLKKIYCKTISISCLFVLVFLDFTYARNFVGNSSKKDIKIMRNPKNTKNLNKKIKNKNLRQKSDIKLTKVRKKFKINRKQSVPDHRAHLPMSRGANSSVLGDVKNFFSNVYDYMDKNPFESVGYISAGLFGITLMGHIPNYVGQYKCNNNYVGVGDNNGKIGGGRNGCTGVWRVRYKSPTDDQENKYYIIKGMRRVFSKGYWLAFGREKFAYEMFEKFKKLKNENALNDEELKGFEHLVPIVDYHYGIGSEYVVYEDAGSNSWVERAVSMNNDDENIKFKVKGLCEIFKQVIRAELFLLNRGVCHGDLHSTNYYVSGDPSDNNDGKPFVHIFDYGCMHKTNFLGTILAKDSLNRELEKMLRGFISLAAYVIEGGEGKDINGVDDKEWKINFNKWVKERFLTNDPNANALTGTKIVIDGQDYYLKKLNQDDNYWFLLKIVQAYWGTREELILTDRNEAPKQFVLIKNGLRKNDINNILKATAPSNMILGVQQIDDIGLLDNTVFGINFINQ